MMNLVIIFSKRNRVRSYFEINLSVTV